MSYVIGLMSGTSLDGCDAVLIELNGSNVRQLGFVTLPMPELLRRRVLDCCSLDRSNIALTCSLNVELGEWFAEAAIMVCEKSGVLLRDIECIGSHGQTVYHIPQDIGSDTKTNTDSLYASTLQLGEPAVIAYRTGLPVVSSFRAMDMAAGGRGAPLVPYAEYLLYRADHPRALQNLGGIGNITVMSANARLDEIIAFDTGPANMVINELVKRLYGLDYDDQGRIAASGDVNDGLLAEWMAVPFVDMPPPKATGRELFGAQFVDAAIAAHPLIQPQDWIATATRYTATCIERNIRLHVFPKCAITELILSGGGARNLTILRDIKQLLPECKILTQEDLGWDSASKEAVAFALLAHETMNRRAGNVPSATGASRCVILGNITPAPLRG
ncbi:anhydro-N-acetylmuramic acid kinase [Clostridia bacterium]|nr:anhydro-N-acetylmuramic acid kinase [Clostridia bacterium]